MTLTVTGAAESDSPGIGRVVVLGASGYVGSRLVPRLLEAGHEVVATTTSPDGLADFPWAGRVTSAVVDARDPAALAEPLEGAQVLYHLVHGMGGRDFEQADRDVAHAVADAARTAGVRRLVYLSGMVPNVPDDELSDHIRSRYEVEQILSAAGPDTTTLRAAVIIGSGSTSFEIIRQISERLPVHLLPDWMDTEVQPVAVVDIVTALVTAGAWDEPTGWCEVAGPDRLPYAALLQRYAEAAGLDRRQVTLPGLPPGLTGTLAGLVTDVPTSTVEALVQSLRHDMVAAERDETDRLLGGRPALGLDESLRRALAPEDETVPPERRDPMGPVPGDPSWSGPSRGLGGAIRAAASLTAAMLPFGS